MRWISRDPLGERGGINLYVYVGNDPVYWTDPLGLAPGQLYGSQGEAITNALRDAYNATMNLPNADKEYGGNIYQTPDNKYSYTAPQEGLEHNGDIDISNDVKCPNKKIADYHSHDAGGASYPSLFPGGDVDKANPAKTPGAVPGYNVGPDGRMWWTFGGYYGQMGSFQ